MPFWPLFPLQVSTLSHKSENWSYQNLALPYYILPPPVLACTTNICSIVVQFFLVFCTFHIFSSPKKCFPRICWRNETHLKLVPQPLISLFQFSGSSLSYNLVPHSTPPSSKCTYTHTIFGYNCINTACSLSSREHCCPISLSWLPVTNLNWIVKIMVFCKTKSITPPTAILVMLRLLVRVRSLNQIPAGNLVPTFLWKPPGCKSYLIDWQVWRRGQQSLGGLVVLEGKGPWWDD